MRSALYIPSLNMYTLSYYESKSFQPPRQEDVFKTFRLVASTEVECVYVIYFVTHIRGQSEGLICPLRGGELLGPSLRTGTPDATKDIIRDI